MTDSANTQSGGDADLPTTDDASLERLKHFGGGKLLGEMITLFVQAAPERISAARAGLESNDAKATEMALHALKSSSAQLGALRMQRLCEQGEALARAGSLENVDGLVRNLEQEFPRVQSWLERARQPEIA
jgi:HPt (histidine-containing phosphotransfer) domain-containing protein